MVDVRYKGKNYKVTKITAQVENNELMRTITNIDMLDAIIENINDKLKKMLIDELSKTNALNHVQRIDENGNTVHTMTLLVLEEVDNNT